MLCFSLVLRLFCWRLVVGVLCFNRVGFCWVVFVFGCSIVKVLARSSGARSKTVFGLGCKLK